MKIALFGASGRTGIQVLKLAILDPENTYTFRVLVRSRQKLIDHLRTVLNQRRSTELTDQELQQIIISRIEVVSGDALKQADVQTVIRGATFVINALGEQPEGVNTGLCSQSQRLINDAIKRNNKLVQQRRLMTNTDAPIIERIVVMTSLGCNESFPDLNWMARMVVTTIVPHVLADKNVQENLLAQDFMSSADNVTDYVIIRAGGLRDRAQTSKYYAQLRYLSGGFVSRCNVAHFMLSRCLVDASVSRKAFSVMDRLRDGDVDMPFQSDDYPVM